MDSRYEPFDIEVLNQLIIYVNDYLRQNSDAVMNQPNLLHLIQAMIEQIYNYVGMRVDLDALLTAKNLLSVDLIPLPLIQDEQSSQVVNEPEKFQTLLQSLQSDVSQPLCEIHQQDFYLNLQKILSCDVYFSRM